MLSEVGLCMLCFVSVIITMFKSSFSINNLFFLLTFIVCYFFFSKTKTEWTMCRIDLRRSTLQQRGKRFLSTFVYTYIYTLFYK